MPGTLVDGVGAVADPVPPVALVYHNSPVPVAVSCAAGWPWQYAGEGAATVGGGEMGLTVTVFILVLAPQPVLAAVSFTVYVPGEA